MGIKGLQFYVEQQCKDVCQTVSIVNLAEIHRSRYRCQPVLVVDGCSILRKWYTSKGLEWIYGGQWCQFAAVVQNFVCAFQHHGIKLVFFFDGTCCKQKRTEWASRRTKGYKDISTVFHNLKTTRTHPDDRFFILPTAIGNLTRHLLKFLCDVPVYTTILEGDQEIADYARKHTEVFAILSQDTDFIIYNTKLYLSVNHLDMETLTTVLYNRDALAREIGLNVLQLPLFSCLIGNDVIPTDSLRHFQQRLCNMRVNPFSNVGILISRVTQLIRDKNWSGNFQNMSELKSIAEIIFPDTMLVELLRDGLKVYSLDLDQEYDHHSKSLFPASLLNEACNRHINCTNSPAIYTLLISHEYETSELLEDAEDHTLPPAAIIYRPIRQRMYSLLQSEAQCYNSHNDRSYSGPHDASYAIKEWCAYVGNPLTAPEIVGPQPLYLSGGIPRLSTLWSLNQDNDLCNLKLSIFLACMDIQVTVDDLQSIPSCYITLVCLLNYLLLSRPPLLAQWEVNAFIAQAVSPIARNLKALETLKVPYVDSRAVHLASVFMRGVATVVVIVSACGWPFPLYDSMPWQFFDGKLFHKFYLESKHGSSVAKLCENQAGVMEHFDHLHSIIVRGTTLEQQNSAAF